MSKLLDDYLKKLDNSEILADVDGQELKFPPLIQREILDHPDYQWVQIIMQERKYDPIIDMLITNFKVNPDTLYEYTTPPNILMFFTHIHEESDSFLLKYDGNNHEVRLEMISSKTK